MIEVIIQSDEPLKLETIAHFDEVNPNMRRLVGIYLCKKHAQELFWPWSNPDLSGKVVFPDWHLAKIRGLGLDRIAWFYDPHFEHTMLSYA